MKKILIVEDDMALSKALSAEMADSDLEVVTAADGLEGYKKSGEEKPDLILLDLLMPNMDGLTMLKKVRAAEKEKGDGKKVPVIILTNATSNESIAEAMENDTFDYLIKSNTSLEQIVSKVKEKLAA